MTYLYIFMCATNLIENNDYQSNTSDTNPEEQIHFKHETVDFTRVFLTNDAYILRKEECTCYVLVGAGEKMNRDCKCIEDKQKDGAGEIFSV